MTFDLFSAKTASNQHLTFLLNVSVIARKKVLPCETVLPYDSHLTVEFLVNEFVCSRSRIARTSHHSREQSINLIFQKSRTDSYACPVPYPRNWAAILGRITSRYHKVLWENLEAGYEILNSASNDVIQTFSMNVSYITLFRWSGNLVRS
jgi:hypothetical protein